MAGADVRAGSPLEDPSKASQRSAVNGPPSPNAHPTRHRCECHGRRRGVCMCACSACVRCWACSP
eukprot:2225778-Prymnesium_polylepis.2